MPRRIIFTTKELTFPPRCVVCQKASAGEYTLSRTIYYANRTILVPLAVPMCTEHLRAATQKDAREQNANRVGLAAGGAVGVLAVLGLLRLWSQTGQGVLLVNLLVAGFVGISLFMVIWSTTNFFIAPLLAGPEVVAARNAVRILRFWPRTGQIQLEFLNDSTADSVAAANPDLVALIH